MGLFSESLCAHPLQPFSDPVKLLKWHDIFVIVILIWGIACCCSHHLRKEKMARCARTNGHTLQKLQKRHWETAFEWKIVCWSPGASSDSDLEGFSFRMRVLVCKLFVSESACVSFRILVSESTCLLVSESAVLVSESALVVSEPAVSVSESALLVSES